MRVVIELFVKLIEPRWCIIKFVINKSTCKLWSVAMFLRVYYKL